jgi:hypothetical protein
MEQSNRDPPRLQPWPQVSEQTLVIAAHDHLQRGIRRREWWADRLPAPQPDEPSGVE